MRASTDSSQCLKGNSLAAIAAELDRGSDKDRAKFIPGVLKRILPVPLVLNKTASGNLQSARKTQPNHTWCWRIALGAVIKD